MSIVDVPAAVREFAQAHPGVTAAVEYLGRKGAMIVLASTDGETTEVPVASLDAARAACEQAGVAVDNGWERELTELARPANDLWRSRSRREMAR